MVVTPGWASRRDLLHRARPLAPAAAARAGAWLILAPHPDDETLGAGGLIAALSHAGARLRVAFLTDGAASHIDAPNWPATRIAGLRAQEAGAALRLLGLRTAPVALGWRDGVPYPAQSRAFERTVRQLVALCRRERIRNVVASWEGDPHCDHAATAIVASEVARRLRVVPSFYLVWGWTLPALDARVADMRVRAMPTARWQGHQRRALACHRTQLGGRISGARESFVLPRAMRRLVDLPHLLLLEPRHAT
ncbi:PIG-L deacetylase family protein [Sphingomonas sp. PB4P5]|uniref:PIG-L deacetylase family protein n=1 Tax=Parasphingomonas puruogangriensis TaxID=3096155 RepID=UPI002FC5DB7B